MAVDIFKHQEGLQEIKDILHEHQGDDISEQEGTVYARAHQFHFITCFS
jgi:hypothetical protein